MRQFRIAALLGLVALLATGCLGLAGGGGGLITGPQVGALSITTYPSNAQIYIDGELSSQRTPAQFSNLPVGTYQVRLVASGYPEFQSQVDIEAGRVTTLDVNLTQASLTGIQGYLTDGRGGSGVAGATVTIKNGAQVAATVTTGADGYFVAPVAPGQYDVVATKSGWATSVFQGVAVQAGALTRADMTQMANFDRANPPVELRVVQAQYFDVNTDYTFDPSAPEGDLLAGVTLTGRVGFVLDVEPVGGAGYPLRTVQLRVGNQQLAADYDYAWPQPLGLNTTVLQNGTVDLYFTVYDMNYNAVHWRIPVQVQNGVIGSKPGMPTGLTADAVTLGKSLKVLSEQQIALDRRLGRPTTPGVLRLPDGKTVEVQSVPGDATLFVQLAWGWVSDAVGYHVYRSWSQTGPWERVGVVPHNNSWYVDADPLLTPGRPVYYQVRAYNASGVEGDPSAVVGTVPLAPFSVRLVAPANGDRGASLVPEFAWQPEGDLGDMQGYSLYVMGLTDSQPSWEVWGFRGTSIRYNADGQGIPLQYGRTYRWDVAGYSARQYGEDASAISVAGIDGYSVNGEFHFTTRASDVASKGGER